MSVGSVSDAHHMSDIHIVRLYMCVWHAACPSYYGVTRRLVDCLTLLSLLYKYYVHAALLAGIDGEWRRQVDVSTCW